MALGYAAAVIVATIVACIVFGLPTIFPDDGAWGSFYRYTRDLPAMLMVGSMMTAGYGFPGWLISVILAERGSVRRPRFFAATGVLTAMLALVLASFGSGFFSEIWLKISCLIGGLVGGLAYWAAAGKVSGAWKRKE
jgi:xanthine/uracil permease